MLMSKTPSPLTLVRELGCPVLHPGTDMDIKIEDCAHKDVSDISRPKDSPKDETYTTPMAALSNWEDRVGVELSDNVVQPFTNIYQDQLDEDFLKEKSTAYPRPANAKALKVPRLSSWLEQVTTAEQKQQDQDLQNIQSYMVASMSAVAGQAQTLLDLNQRATNSSHPDISHSTHMFAKPYASLMDANILMTKAMYDTNEFRRKLIKQGMNDSLMSLLDENKPTPEWLAGKDVGTLFAGVKNSFGDKLSSGTSPKNDNGAHRMKLSCLTEKMKDYSESDGAEQFIFASSPEVQKNSAIGERHHFCVKCGRGFKQAVHLRDHMRTHTGEKPYTCPNCGKRFTVLSILKTHMRTHCGEKHYVCFECGKGFSQLLLLTTHMTTHKRENAHVSSDKCDKFENVFTKENSGTKNMVNMGCDERSVVVEKDTQPPYLTKKEEDYAEPDGGEEIILASVPKLPIHKAKGKRCYVCTDCGKRFKQAGHLKAHMLTHTGEKPHVCSDCGKEFNVVGNLKIHMRTHTRKKPHVCSECGKRFCESKSLQAHMRRHTGEEPSICYDCGIGFSQLRDLKKHMKEKHNLEKANESTNIYEETKNNPSTCSKCCERFSDMGSLMAHMIAHTENPARTEKSLIVESYQDCHHASEKENWDSDSEGTVEYRPSSPEDYTMTDTDEELHMDVAKEFSSPSRVQTGLATEFVHPENAVVQKSDKSEQLFTEKNTSETKKWMDTTHNGEHLVVEKDLKLPYFAVKEEVDFEPNGDENVILAATRKGHQHGAVGGRCHVCLECGEDFSLANHLRDHMRTHMQNISYMSSDSGKAFNFVQELRGHMRSHTGELPPHRSGGRISHVCPECGKQFKGVRSLKVHMKVHTGENICSECGKGFGTLSILKTHMVTHKSEKPFVCSDCGKKFTCLSTLKNHVKTHTGEKPHVCPHCAKAFSISATLRVHMMTHTGEKPFVCEDCGKGFRTSALLKMHTRVHTGENRCSECGKGFGSLNILKVHMRIHTGVKPFACSYCNKVYSTAGNLKTHMTSHTGQVAHLCSDCGKTFTSLGNLQNHIKTLHMGEKPHKCSYCGNRFGMTSQLKTHIRIHTGERPYVCDMCGKGFRASCYLTSHMRVHTGEKPYACSDCGMQFRTGTMLKRHRTTHTGEKFFACSECGKGFNSRWHVNAHMRTHTGEKPFVCSDCGKAFSESATLRKHANRIHTGESKC